MGNSENISKLAEYIRKVASQDFSAPLAVNSGDQLEPLAGELKNLARNYSMIFETLEQSVLDATGELEDTLTSLKAIIDNMADGLLVTSPDGKITLINPALKTMFDLQKHDDLMGKDSKVTFGDNLADLCEQSQTYPDRIHASDIPLAENRIGKAIVTSIYKKQSSKGLSSGECLGKVILVRDITNEKKIDQMKSEFLSTVSHELRTPLTSVIGFVEIIQEKLNDVIFPVVDVGERKVERVVNQITKNLKIVVSEGERLTTLINDLLDLSKMEAGKIEWRDDLISISEIIDHATDATNSLYENKGLKMIKEVEEGLPPIIGDRDRLVQVLINLISNAVKFTHEGSIICKAKRKDGEVLVSVIDSGEGIVEEDLSEVFERFKQVGDTLTDKPKGTGLGLPICKQIVTHHGGGIWVESRRGEGSTFFFTLPIKTVPDNKMEFADIGALLRKVKDHIITTEPKAKDKKKLILVVDDDAHIRELLRQELEEAGYDVREAVDGFDAVKQVKSEVPDLVIMDVMMPGMSGFDAAAVLKNDPLTAAIPIVILSIIQDQERGHRLGIDRYFTKPVNKEVLLRDIEMLTSERKSKKEALVIDSDTRTLETLKDALEGKGYTVDGVCTGSEGMEKARTLLPDLIVVDSKIYEEEPSIKTLRFEKGLENVFILVLSGKNPL